jgi:hypothetical protein
MHVCLARSNSYVCVYHLLRIAAVMAFMHRRVQNALGLKVVTTTTSIGHCADTSPPLPLVDYVQLAI